MTFKTDERGALLRRCDASSAFDLLSKDAEAVTIADIARLRQTLEMASLVSVHEQPTEWVHRLALFNRAWSILVSSLQLVRCRVPKDAFTLLRTALEAAAVGVLVSRDEQAFAKYTTGRLEATKAIGPVARLVPHFGRVNGILSQIAVHVNVRTYGPLVSGEGALTVSLFQEELEPRDDEVALCLVSVVSLLIFRAAELALFEPVASQAGWLQTFGGTHLVSPLAQAQVNKKYSALESLLATSAIQDGAREPFQAKP